MSVAYLIICIVYLTLGIGGSLLLYHRVFSPLGILGGVFGIVSLLLIFPVVQYVSLNNTTMVVLIIVMLAFFLGTLAAIFPWRMSHKAAMCRRQKNLNVREIQVALLFSNLIATLGLALQWYFVIRFFGGATAFVAQIPLLYVSRLAQALKMPPWAGYMASVGFAGIYLAGHYIGAKGDNRILPFWSWVIILAHSLVTMGRASIIWGGLLFLNGIMLSQILIGKSAVLSHSMLRQGIRLVVLGVVLFGLMLGVRQIRAGGDNFQATADNIRDYSLICRSDESDFLCNAFLSNYVYLTGSVPALGQILERGTGIPENWGVNTFGSVFRRLGMTVPRYLEPVNIPFPFNVYTAVADWYLDFGWMGILIVPFIIGFASSFLFEKTLNRSISTSALAVLSFLFLWLEFSVFFSLSSQGFFWIALIWLYGWGIWLDRTVRT